MSNKTENIRIIIASLVVTALIIVSSQKITEKAKPIPNGKAIIRGTAVSSGTDTMVLTGREFEKTIQINDEGYFADTLDIVPGRYQLTYGLDYIDLYLDYGYNLDFKISQTNMYDELNFSGKGEKINNYLADRLRYDKFDLMNYNEFFMLDKEEFDKKVESVNDTLTNMLATIKDQDSAIVNDEEHKRKSYIKFLKTNYKERNRAYKKLEVGSPSPMFTFKDKDGNDVSLEDFKGKYTYIDIWASWCIICERDFNHFNELSQYYKNINFIGISIDPQDDINKWKNHLKKYNLKGVQLLSDDEYRTDFMKTYSVTGVPRAILLDPDLKIVKAFAPTPSNPQLLKLLIDLDF